MNPRQRIEAVFNGETPDVMAWYGDLTYWYAAHKTIGDLPETYRGDGGLKRLHMDTGTGQHVPGCRAYKERINIEIQNEEKDGRRVTTYVTDAGQIQSVRDYSPQSWSWGWLKYPVQTEKDLDVLEKIIESITIEENTASVVQMNADLTAHGLPIVAAPESPFIQLFKSWVGIMNLTYLLMDAPQKVNRLLGLLREVYQTADAYTARADCKFVMLPDNLSAEVMGGYFENYLKDDHTRRVNLFHVHNQKTMVHIDGTLRGLMEKLPVSGIDCLESTTPAPVGDVAPKDLRALAGPNVIIMGGVPGAMFAAPFSDEDMKAHILTFIDLYKSDGKFIFDICDQIPPDGSIERVRMISDLIEEHGRY